MTRTGMVRKAGWVRYGAAQRGETERSKEGKGRRGWARRGSFRRGCAFLGTAAHGKAGGVGRRWSTLGPALIGSAWQARLVIDRIGPLC